MKDVAKRVLSWPLCRGPHTSLPAVALHGAGLARLASNFDRQNQGVVATLDSCLRDSRTFARVRAEAALVMGATADATSSYAAVPMLCK